MPDLAQRAFNGTLISRRLNDGYVNATAMAKASGKQWSDYFRADRATTYLEALSRNSKIPVTSLYTAKPGEGTWIHPRLAVDFARWISADFAVWMDSWFIEEFQNATKVNNDFNNFNELSPSKTIRENAEGIVFIWDALESRGLADDRDRIELKRDLKVLHNALVYQSTGLLPGTSSVLAQKDLLPRFQNKAVDVDAPLTIIEFASAYLSRESDIIQKYDSEVGRLVAPMYRDRHQEEPMTTIHLSVKAEEARRKGGLGLFNGAKNGCAVSPKIYCPRDWDLIIRALRSKGLIQPDRAAELLAECQQFRPNEQ